MATIHRATIEPTKPQLLHEWVPGQPWGRPEFEVVGAYRFDDPAGAVGIETFVLAGAHGALLQVPLTYRDAALPGAERFLIATMEHSVLGRRWVYDGCGDILYARVLAAVLFGRAVQAEEFVDGATEAREPSVRVTGSGSSASDLPPIDTAVTSTDPASTVIEAGALRVVVRRRIDLDVPGTGSEPTLTGRWTGVEDPVLLAYAE